MLVMPIAVLFYQSNQLTMHEIFIIQAVYSLSIVVFEIPSGYFADVLGRKKTIFLGAVFGVVGFSFYSLTYGFWGFLVAEIILGIGQSMISGADSALLYDSLTDDNQEQDYVKLEGKMISIGNFAEAVAGILGGLLATWSLRYPYYGQILVSFIAVPSSLLLIEPHCSKTRIELGWKQIVEVLRFSFSTRLLRWNILYSSFVGVSTLTMAWFVQPWFIREHVPTEFYGLLWTALNVIVGLSAMLAYKIQHYWGEKNTHILFNTGIVLGFLGAAWTSLYIGILFIAGFYIARGLATPILKNNINKSTPSNIRATVLSIRNFFIRILFALIGPLLGYANDMLTLEYALTIAALLFGLLIFVSFIAFVKSGNLLYDTER